MGLRRVLAAVGAGLASTASILVSAQPAYAHAGSGTQPSNYHVQIRSLRPPAPGVEVQVGTGGQWVRITSRGAEAITVAGYAGEPFLRLTGDRIQVNRHSTTLADNPGLASAPAAPRPDAHPQWVAAGTGRSVAWSDGRVSAAPPTGAGGAGRARTGQHHWTVPLQVDGRRVTVNGTRTWVPPPTPWPWAAGLAGATLAAATVGWLRRWRLPAVAALVLAGGAYAAHLAGSALAPHAGSAAAGWAAAAGTGLLCWAFVAVGVVTTCRGSAHAAFAVAVAGAAVAVISASDLPVLWHSQLSFTWAASVERTLVVLTLGVGAGLAAGGIRLIRQVPVAADTDPAGAGSANPDPPRTEGEASW